MPHSPHVKNIFHRFRICRYYEWIWFYMSKNNLLIEKMMKAWHCGEIGTAICLSSLKNVSVKSKCTQNSFNMGLVLNNMSLSFYIQTPVALPLLLPEPLPSVLDLSTPPSFLFWNRQASDVYWQNMTYHVAVRRKIFSCIKSRQDNPVWGRGSQMPAEDTEIAPVPTIKRLKRRPN